MIYAKTFYYRPWSVFIYYRDSTGSNNVAAIYISIRNSNCQSEYHSLRNENFPSFPRFVCQVLLL